jgi:hypothetical protein
MSRIRIFIAAGLIAVGAALAPWGRADEPMKREPTNRAQAAREEAVKESLADEVKRLRAANAKLQDENRRLRHEIKELKSRIPAILPELPSLKLQPAAPAMPKNAIPREFNGETYYLVPLTGRGGTPLHGENQDFRPASNLPVTQPGR